MMITRKNFIKNDAFLILCLNISIDIIEPIVPPTKDDKSSLFSDTLRVFLELFKDFSLS